MTYCGDLMNALITTRGGTNSYYTIYDYAQGGAAQRVLKVGRALSCLPRRLHYYDDDNAA